MAIFSFFQFSQILCFSVYLRGKQDGAYVKNVNVTSSAGASGCSVRLTTAHARANMRGAAAMDFGGAHGGTVLDHRSRGACAVRPMFLPFASLTSIIVVK